MAQDVLGIENYPEWDLTDLYSSDTDPAIERDWALCETESAAFQAKFKGVFNGSAWTTSNLFEAITTYETIQERFGRLGSYTGLRYYKNIKDQDILLMYQKTQERLTNLSSRFIFFTLELNEIEDTRLEAAFATSSELERYRPYFDQIRTFKNHQLTPDLEKVFLEKSLTSSRALNRLYDETLASMSFNVDGTALSLSGVTELMSDANPTKRRQGAMALAEGLSSKASLFAFITNTLAKDKEIEDKWRTYASPMHERHLANQVEADVVNALVVAVKQSYPRLSHRYYALKAKMMGIPVLQYWDRNAPLSDADDETFTWLETRKIVMDAYQAFSPKIAAIAGDFFDKNWIDVPSTDGKTSGAFSHPTVPTVHPYVLLNFHGKKRDVMTLAHELGHGVHQVLAADQGYLLSDTPLTLAETASVFGEMLTFQNLLKHAKNPSEKRQMLAGKIEDMLNTVVRQIAFYLFEEQVHTRRKTSELSIDDINSIWLETQKEALGEAVHLDPLVGSYWAYISHFIHSPFYVYAYAFGDCLVNSLFAVYQNNPEGFQEKYIDLLKAGGSKRHKELLAPFGLDASNPNFWTQGLSMIEGLIDELESLVE
ncbi:MAG: M3 family oligoendopeptidase [Candidatus Paracaedibacteraceae bacterium]|nr:M3 family oligoendopeptidase [Candidatus Paracaedibacteraceae bacterium]